MPFDQLKALLHTLHIGIAAHPFRWAAGQRPAKLNASHRVPPLYQVMELVDTSIVMQGRKIGGLFTDRVQSLAESGVMSVPLATAGKKTCHASGLTHHAPVEE